MTVKILGLTALMIGMWFIGYLVGWIERDKDEK